MKGGYFGLGDFEPPDVVIHVAEGFATERHCARSNGGAPVAVAFSCGQPRLRWPRRSGRRIPDAALVICADDDAATPDNPRPDTRPRGSPGCRSRSRRTQAPRR